jgi:hypothetical protein
LFIAIPDREREHPIKSLEGVNPVEGVLAQQRLRVGVGAEGTVSEFQFSAQFDVVINLAVIDNVIASI